MSYLRFVRPNRISHLDAREGFFCAAYALRDSTDLDPYSADYLEDLLDWFREHLPIPDRFHRSRSNRDEDRDTAGLSWFKPGATEAIERSYELISLLEQNGYVIETIRSERIGYIVYEDDQQVIAEPFADTPR